MISIEKRKLIVAAHGRGMSVAAIEEAFQVGKTAVYNLFQLVEETGSVEPRPHSFGRPPVLDVDGLNQMDQLIAARPDITLQEIKDAMGLAVTIADISYTVRNKLHYRHKKRRYMPVNATAAMCAQREKRGVNGKPE